MRLKFFAPAFFLLPLLCSAASKEIVELQRDISLLQDQVRALQRSIDERSAALTVLVQQTLDAANKTTTAVAVLESGVRDRLREQEKNVVAPVAGVGSKVDQMGMEFQSLKESVTDVSARMGKLQQQILDLSNAVKTMQAPPLPPAPAPGPASGVNSTPGSGAPPLVPAELLYQNASRDRSGGKSDLALQQYNDYLKYYGNTELAPNAQYYIGEIYYARGDLEGALKNFDLVLEKFPANNKTADALYMKGQTFIKMNKRTQAAREFQELNRRYPNSELAAKARTQLKAMGLSTSSGSRRR